MMDFPHTHHKPWIPWIIWLTAAIFYAYEFFLQVSPSIMVPDLMRAFQVNAEMLGTISAAYFWAYLAMQIPVGVLLDWFGPRRVLSTAALLCALGALMFANSHDMAWAVFARIFIGIGSAFAAVGAMTVAAHWFPPTRFAFITGLLITLGMTGATFGEAPLAILVNATGWRETLQCFALVGVAVALCIYFIVRDNPPEKSTSTHGATWQDCQDLLFGLKGVLLKAQNWTTAIYGGLMFAPTLVLGPLWGVPYLCEWYHFTNTEAGGLISLIYIGWAFGSPTLGYLSDHIKRRKPVMLGGSIASLALLIIILYVPTPTGLLAALLFAFGFASSGFLASYSIIRETHPASVHGTALGYMNMVNTIGGAIIQPLIGAYLDHHWEGTLHEGARVYTVGSFQMGLSVLPACIVIALVLLPFIPETYCKESS